MCYIENFIIFGRILLTLTNFIMTRTMTKSSLLLIIIFSTLFFSCEKENLVETPIQNKYVVKNFKFSDLKSKSSQVNADLIVTKGLEIIKTKEPQNRGANAGFTIDSTSIKEISIGNYRTYTMLVKRDEVTKDYFENIIVEIDSLEHCNVYLNKYYPDQKIVFVPEHDTHTFHGETVSSKYQYPISFYTFTTEGEFEILMPGGDGVNQQPMFSINCVSVLKCNYGGTTHNAGPNCDVTYTVVECTSTFNNGSVGGGGVGPGSWGSSGTGGNSNYGGGGNNNTGTTGATNPVTPTPPITSIITPPFTDSEMNAENIIANEFYYPLSKEKKLYVHTKLGLYQSLVEYLSLNITNNIVNPDALLFAQQLVNSAITETNQADVNNLVGLSLAVKQSGDAIFEDSFDEQVDQFVDMDLSNPPITPHLFGLHYFINIQKLKNINPEWSYGKCAFEAGKPYIHLSLDAFGLIPVVGEVADLVNGAIYAVEGDGLNATLSLASAIPIVGYGSTASKYAIKIKTAYGSSNKVKLVWKVLPGNIVYFGTDATCRKQLRKALNMVVGNLNQAHHIIPVSLQSNPIVQKAFKSSEAFHLNEALNGISLSTLVHNGSHSNYNNQVLGYLNQLSLNASPAECYNKVNEIITKVRIAIANNPNIPINQLTF